MSSVWKCPTEDHWQRYLLDSDYARRTDMSRHLASCSRCRILVEGMQSGLNELESAWDASSRPDVIYLSLPFVHSDPSAHTVLLAAEGERDPDATESATLSAPGEEVLMRLVRDRHSRDVWLYVVTHDLGSFRNVVVKPFGADAEYMTDSEGRVNLGPIEWPSPEQMIAELHLPRAVFTLKPVDWVDEDQQVTELKSPQGDRIRITMRGKGQARRLGVQILEISGLVAGIPLKVALKSPDREGMAWIQPVTGDRAEFSAEGLGESIEVYLYQ